MVTISPARIIRQLLIDVGLGTTSGLWPVFYSGEPNQPENCITVTDTTGVDHGRSSINGERWEHCGYQIRVRSSGYDEGYEKASIIARTLDEDVYLNVVQIDGDSYLVHSVNRTGGINSLGRRVPTSKRNVFTLNGLSAIMQVQY